MGRRWVAGILLVGLIAGCTNGDDRTDTTDRTTSGDTHDDDGTSSDVPVTVDGVPVTGDGAGDDDQPAVLGLRLSEGQASTTPGELLARVDGTPLTPDEIDAVLARLPEWTVPPDDVTQFNRPADTLEPPLIGATIDTPVPPPTQPAGPPNPDAGELHVVRFQPEGPVDVAPFLTVTFDQPMVPLATLEQLDQSDVPVVITPAVEGRWRWIGTRTLRFEVIPGATDRLPAATEYRAEVPAGTVAANGATLAEAVAWTFTTPAPQVTGFTGESDSLPLEPVFVAVFDQRVDPAAVVDTITIDAGGQRVGVRVATAAEVENDDAARAVVAGALPDRAVAFRATDRLPVDTALTIAIGPGTPSREGPLTTAAPATYHAHTFGALRVVDTTCSYAPNCVPGVPLTIELSNALDAESFGASLVTVEPEIPGMRIDVYGSTIQISGATEGRTTYHVTLDGALRDVFGQTLGEDTEVTFDVGPAQPTLYGLQRDWITTDPMAATPTVSIQTVNHDDVHVEAWAVTSGDLAAFRAYLERTYSETDPADPQWQKVMDETVAISSDEDRFVETPIDLSAAFAASGSQLVVRIEPTEQYTQNDELYWMNRPTVAWVQRTTLGIDAIVDNDELLIWTTDLTTGAPVAGVSLELVGDGRTVTTDGDGVARVEFGSGGVVGLAASAGDREALLPSPWYQPWARQATSDESRWYVFDDRGIYRPGETVRITGWVRQLPWADDTHLQLVDDASAVGYQVTDVQGVELATGNAQLNALGGFNLAIDLPPGANLGPAYVNLTLPSLGGSGSTMHQFQIQEFRRPEFAVTARTETSAPYFAGQPATVAVDAEYYAGGPLPNAPVTWLVGTTETSYQPPNWDDYTFGVWHPWWFADDFAIGSRALGDFASPCFDCPPGMGTDYQQYTGTTDGSGTHYLQVDFDGPDVDLPNTVTAEATVEDVNRQAWSSRTSLLVHAAREYVGLRTDRTFVEQGSPIRYDAVVTDLDGALVAGRPVTVTAGRVEWGYADGEWQEQIVDEQQCALTSTADATDQSMRCEFPTSIGGTYRVTAIVTDETGHRNRTQTTMWVSGGPGLPTRDVDQQAVTVVPDHETYAPGDTAELLVQAPFAPATGLMTVIKRGIVSTQRFDATDGSAVLQIPIDDGDVPNLTVQVDMVGATARTADDGTALPDSPLRPAYATGRITLSVPPVTRALAVTATPAEDAVTPGTDTSVTVQVTGPDGQPVPDAAVALVVVDEAVLALTGYQLLDPLDVFYAALWSNVSTTYARSSILLTRSDLLNGLADEFNLESAAATTAPAGAMPASEAGDNAAQRSLDAAGGAPLEKQLPQIDVRDNFDALAVYAPDEATDASGSVTVDVPLPDSLTRYRVMAVAIDGAEHFGKGESTITARLPVMVRPSAPRFLNFGDQFELPVVVQNQTDAPLAVDVVVQGSNLVFTSTGLSTSTDADGDAAGRRVMVPANDRVEVRFPARTDQVGTARFRVAGAGADGVGSDAAVIELPVYTPATTEAFATYGVIDDATPGGAIGQPISAPAGVFPQFGGLEIGTSSTALQALTDAVLYLEDYPYQTADGYASRIMAIASLRDVLDAFDADGLPDPAALNARMDADIAALAALQNDDGGWSWWARGLESSPWQSIQSTHALVLAQQAGYDVPANTLNAAIAFLADIESHIPSDCSEAVRTALRAYAIHVRTLAGDRDAAKATAIYNEQGDDLQLDAMAWLWPSIDDASIRSAIERRLENAATETANAVTFATSYGEDDYLIANSDRRTDGVILDALIGEAPGSDLIVKTVNGLLGHQTRGRWNSAQDNAFILIAMNRYFDTFESVTPDIVARAWIGDTYAAEHEYRGRTTDRDNTLVPMDQLTQDTTVVVQREGTGRLYYRLGLRYAPDDLQLDARDEGFVVDRVYEAVDDPGDVTRDADGTWHIRAGAKVRVRLTMVADARRTHVALVDPLPAGLEPVNPALQVSQTTPPEDTGADAKPWCWCWQWFEHQNMRDDRVEAFTSYLAGGTYEYTYIARATTPGEFVVPPAKAEELYATEVFGRSASTTLVVSDTRQGV
jgi:uncharacterized protein YfaS (alpha-2-macroglobulin family)